MRVILAVLSQDSVNVKSDTFGASDLSQLQPLSAFDNSVVITGLFLSSVQVYSMVTVSALLPQASV